MAASAAAEPLENAIRAALGQAKLGKCRVGIAVYDCDSQEALASIEAQRDYAPASNLKLLTSGVALSVLGERFEFRTSFVMDGTKLIIKGAGDPAFGDPKLLAELGSDVEKFIGRIVDAAKAAKVSGITEIVVDDRVFSREGAEGKPGVNPEWPESQLNHWYCAPVCGLNFYTNVIELRAAKGERVGMRPDITTYPKAPWLVNLEVAARTSTSAATSLWAVQDTSMPAPPFTFRVQGSVRVKESNKDNALLSIDVTVNQPGLFFAGLLGGVLREKGLTEGGKMPTVRLTDALEEIKVEEKNAFAVVTTPIEVALKRCNTDSQNLYAECLLKRVAFEVTQQPGSWSNGAQVVRMRIGQKIGGGGQDLGNLQIADGSGLAAAPHDEHPGNLITPWLMVRWLGAIRQDPELFQPFVESMARADDKTTKVAARFKEYRPLNTIYAKTGYINNVLCLSGYVVGRDSKRCIAYSVLVNDAGGTPADRVKDFQKDVVEIVDKYIGKTSAPIAIPALGG